MLSCFHCLQTNSEFFQLKFRKGIFFSTGTLNQIETLKKAVLIILTSCFCFETSLAQRIITGVVRGSGGRLIEVANVEAGYLLVVSQFGYNSQKIKAGENQYSEISSNTDCKNRMLQDTIPGRRYEILVAPGEKSDLKIHGLGNFGDVRPLIVIDGMEGDINVLNPQDIESIEVLKVGKNDPIYGKRGANGVILITTKKAKAGKPKLYYDFYMKLIESQKELRN